MKFIAYVLAGGMFVIIGLCLYFGIKNLSKTTSTYTEPQYTCTDYECVPVVGFYETYEDTHNSGGISFGLTSNGIVPVIGSGNTVSTTEHKYYIVFTVKDTGYLLTTNKYDLYLLLCNMDSFIVTEKPDPFFGGYCHCYNDYRLDLKELTNGELNAYIKMAEGNKSEDE